MNKREKEVQQAYLNNEKAVLKKLEGNYKDALDEINSKIEILLARQDADMQHVIYQVEYQKALKTQVQSILETLQANEFETLSDYLTKSYEDGFIGTMYNLQGQGIPLVFPIDQEQIVAAIQHETKLSTNLYTALGLDVKELNKKIAGEISRGIATGAMYAEIARNVAGYARIPRNNAMRIARTEAHRIQTKASMNACEKAKSKGADVVKQWDAAMDKRTRDSHREVDGEVRELEESFSNGLMYPGDPSGRPEEVINCRCALTQRARWNLGSSYTKWSEDAPVVIDDEGTTQFTIIEAKNYEDFQKKYKQATQSVRENVQMMNDEDTEAEAKETYNVLHGTRANFEEFDIEMMGSATDPGLFGAGAYFTDQDSVANNYAYYGKNGGHVMEVKLSFKNPLKVDGKEAMKLSHEYTEKFVPLDDELMPLMLEDLDEYLQARNKMLREVTKEMFIDKGYDGMIIDWGGDKGKEFVAFENNAIFKKKKTK